MRTVLSQIRRRLRRLERQQAGRNSAGATLWLPHNHRDAPSPWSATPEHTTQAITPHAGAQSAALASPADVVIYGGAAGGGKSMALLLEAARHVHNPRFGATIFRKTYAQIVRNVGSLWEQSARLYPQLGGTPRRSELSWVFPSGARIAFGHLQNADTVLNYQGAEMALIEIDELTHVSAYSFWYLFSRNRSTCGVRPYVRASCNPDADSWVADLIAWWIDQTTGFPIPERAGVLRWFVRHGDGLEWADTADELRERFPDQPPKSMTFVPAKLEDNPTLTKANPEYLANLLALPYVERMRLLAGSWKVRAAAGKVYNRAWFEVVRAAPAGGADCRFWDFAASVKAVTGDDPDYTAGVLLRLHDGVVYVLDVIAVREAPAEAVKTVVNTAKQDAERSAAAGAKYQVAWELEPGAGSRYNSQRLVAALAGIRARGVPPRGDKVTRAGPLSAQAEAGNVKVVAGAWNERFLSELHAFPDGAHDDVADASASCFVELLTNSQKWGMGL